jgi:hypothetical protein
MWLIDQDIVKTLYFKRIGGHFETSFWNCTCGAIYIAKYVTLKLTDPRNMGININIDLLRCLEIEISQKLYSGVTAAILDFYLEAFL